MRASTIASLGMLALAGGILIYKYAAAPAGPVSAPDFGAVSLIGPADGRSFANDLRMAADGAVLLAGQSGEKGWLVALDADLDPLWRLRDLGYAGRERASLFAAPAFADATLALGAAWSGTTGPALIARRVADGAEQAAFDAERPGFFMQIQDATTLDDGAVYAGALFGADEARARLPVLTRLGADGAILWRRDDLDFWPAAVAPHGGGGVYVAGWTPADAADHFGALSLVRINPDGETVWMRGLRADAADRAFSLAARDGGGALVGGFLREATRAGLSPAVAEAVVQAYDAQDGEDWRAVLEFPGRDSSVDAVIATPDGGALAGGHAIPRDGASGALWLWRISSAGETLWTREIARSPALDSISDIARSGDAAVIAVSAAGDREIAQVALFRVALDAGS